jgi:hypothetical protein
MTARSGEVTGRRTDLGRCSRGLRRGEVGSALDRRNWACRLSHNVRCPVGARHVSLSVAGPSVIVDGVVDLRIVERDLTLALADPIGQVDSLSTGQELLRAPSIATGGRRVSEP